MAKKAKIKYRYVKRHAAKKTAKRANNLLNGTVGQIAGGMAYGAVRKPISDMFRPVADRIPAGEIADEVVLGLACLVGKKVVPGPFKKIPSAGLTIESSRIGEYIAQKALGGMMGGSPGVSAGGLW